MPRYYMHLVGRDSILLDTEGVELPFAAVPRHVRQSARDCIAGDVLEGRLELGYCIKVQDESGREVYRLEFVDALERFAKD